MLAAAPCDALDGWLCVHSRPRAGGPAVFLDRDGTIIENSPYLADPDGVVLIPGAREAIAAYRKAGFAVIVVTNQSGVARGLCTPEQYHAVAARVLEYLGPNLVDAVYACPFHPDGHGAFAVDHPWRKPRAGMLLDAAERFELDLGRSAMVGDSLSDIQAGAAAAVGTLIHVETGHGRTERPAVKAYAAVMALEPGMPSIRYAASIGDLGAIE